MSTATLKCDRPDDWAPVATDWLTPVLLLAGFGLYEWTGQPALGALVACAKFAIEDVATAAWLRRADPRRDRGRAMFWLYVASGLWKAAVVGVVVMIAVASVQAFWPAGGRPAEAPSPALLGALAAAGLGFAASALATQRAFEQARSADVRLWMDDRVHSDRRDERWPPRSGPPGRANRAGDVLFTALLMTTVGVIGIGFACLAVAAEAWVPGRFGVAPQALPVVLMLAFLGGVVVALPLALLHLRETVGRLTLAKSPDECWGETADDSAPD